MTVEELKIEAKKHGYYLQKATESYERLLPCCKCGVNRRAHFIPRNLTKYEKMGIRCEGCGFTVLGSSEYAIRKKWNDLNRKENT